MHKRRRALEHHVADTLAISFDSDARWRVRQVSLGLEAEVSRSLATFDVRHACLSDHMPSHVRWASRRTISQQELMPTNDHPLPNTKLSDQLVDGTWSEFYDATSSLGPTEKTARLRQLAAEVAFVNGYEYSQDLSAWNSQRTERYGKCSFLCSHDMDMNSTCRQMLKRPREHWKSAIAGVGISASGFSAVEKTVRRTLAGTMTSLCNSRKSETSR